MHRLVLLALLAAGLAISAGARADEGQGIVMRALDESVNLTIADSPIQDALAQITAKTGLKVTLDADALALLPHGEQTRLKLTAKNVTLREALTAMLAPMSLEWRVEDSQVVVTPSHPLIRITRRPTFTEVRILSQLAGGKLVAGQPVQTQLRQITGVEELGLVWQSISEPDRDKALASAEARLPATGADYLNALCQGQGWTWYVWGTDVVILPQELQASRQLMKRVSLRYRNQPLLTVLLELADKAHLKLIMDPGVLNALPAPTRDSFTLVIDSTIAQALQAISGATGLEFKPDKMGIHVVASPALATAPQATTRPRASVFIMVTIPGPSGETLFVPIRPDDLPTELVQEMDKTIQTRKADIIQKLMAQYGVKAEIPKPATQPTTTTTPGR